VHSFFGETEVVIDLLVDGNVDLASRVDAIRPANARRADVRRVLNVAAEHFEALVALWESIHGNQA
jgi:hypothetical protein